MREAKGPENRERGIAEGLLVTSEVYLEWKKTAKIIFSLDNQHTFTYNLLMLSNGNKIRIRAFLSRNFHGYIGPLDNRVPGFYITDADIDEVFTMIDTLPKLKNFKCPVCREIQGPMTEEVAKDHPGAFMFYE